MIRALTIKNYRTFDSLRLEGIERVNLLVGRNNSGKTSLLEAIHLLASGANPEVLFGVMSRRGELLPVGDVDRERRESEFDPGFMFRNHDLSPGSFFEIGSHNNTTQSVRFDVVKSEPPRVGEVLFDAELGIPSDLAIVISGPPTTAPVRLVLSREGGISASPRMMRLRSVENPQTVPSTFISTESLGPAAMARMWDTIALTDEELEVIRALQILENRVEKVAFLAGDNYRYGGRGGIVVKLAESSIRMPLGSMGDGVRRMLALSLAVIRSKGGTLLVDEIDTGLHHSVMADMWRMVIQTASRLEVQLFATTHSQDCVNSLAWLCSADTSVAKAVGLQRIEACPARAVRYSADELAEASARHIEVR